jgi:phosphoserine phosphatase RsbU/P
MPVGAEFFEMTTRNWRAKLAISVDVMRELSRFSDPDEMYHAFARRMNQLYPTTRQISITRRGLDDPAFRVLRFSEWKDPVNPYKELHRLPVSQGGLFAELIENDEPCIIDQLDLTPDDPAYDFLEGQGSLLAIPIYEDGETVNLLIVTREEPFAFAPEQVPELVWMTNLFGRAMQAQVLSEQLREAYQTADYELRVIADLQQSLLPSTTPTATGLDVAVHSRTVNRVGGDYYDFFPLSDGRLGVLIADVSGHGSPAAVLMAITHSLAHSFSELPKYPGKFLGHLNTSLSRRYVGTSGHFVTAFYAVFDVNRNEMTYSNAGHLAPRIMKADGDHWEPMLNQQRLPLGVNARQTVYPETLVPFGPGDRAILFTDGLIDSPNRNGERFGYEHLNSIPTASTFTSDDIRQRVLKELDTFTGNAPMTDDQTMVVVSRVENLVGN